METLELISTICTRVMAIVALLVALIKPLREWVFGWSAIKEGQRCLLRSDMLHTYYKHKDERKIRQYEAENFARAYKAYKAHRYILHWLTDWLIVNWLLIHIWLSEHQLSSFSQ